MNRRHFFKGISGLLAVIPGLSACDREDKAQATRPESDSIDRVLLDSFADTIVPEDQDPGAVAAGIPDSLMKRFASKPERGKQAAAMLQGIDAMAHQNYQRSFAELDIAHREKLLGRIEKSSDPDLRTLRNLVRRLRSRILHEFYMSPAGREMLGYAPPFPGGYPDYNQPPPRKISKS
jgi:hypothetical protein